MKYVSTRGSAPELAFDDVLLAGLARDGGLYVPASWPQFSAEDIRALQGKSYADVAYAVVQPFIGGTVSDLDLKRIIDETYAGFDEGVAPLKDFGKGLHVLELFHGPTLAFKDYALQFLGRMFDHILLKRGQKVTITGATSGDTGSAAIEACRDREAIEIFILHPEGRVSDVQRRQMTTVLSDNVHNVAVKGTFDDCQNMVKAMFNDLDFRDKYNLSAVNSINWCRIMAQIVYYFWAALKLGSPDKTVNFAVPTGNFGNVFAGYAAKQMGLPIGKLIVGSNSNDILTRFFNSGKMEMSGVHPTISPSMDIQISSNFERFLFDLHGRNGASVTEAMKKFSDTGLFDVTEDMFKTATALFEAYRYDDDETKAVIKREFDNIGELLDPHSAIGVAAGRDAGTSEDAPTIALATAHPAKFPAAVEDASGQHPALPERLSDLFDREERFDVLDNDLAEIQAYIEARLASRTAA